MNILETMLSGGGGGIVNQLASQFGISPGQATSATSALVPALAGGMQERLASGDASGIADLISSGKLTQFADNSDSLASPAALDQGKTLLSKIFGSGDTGHMASMVAEKVGLGSGVIQLHAPDRRHAVRRVSVEEGNRRRQPHRYRWAVGQRRAQWIYGYR